MTYDIEISLVSENGYDTPEAGKRRYGKYSRDNYIAHWWGEPGKVGTHDETVAYIQSQANRGKMSVNYVLSNDKITMLVNPDNVSWGAFGGNATGINVEHEPTLNDEGYKKAGWLKWQLEGRYGKQLGIKRHSDYATTACPGNLDSNRIEAECDLWRSGKYEEDIVKPTKKEVREVFTTFLFTEPTEEQLDYYTDHDERELYKDVLLTTCPRENDIREAFKQAGLQAKPEQLDYYKAKSAIQLFRDIAFAPERKDTNSKALETLKKIEELVKAARS